MRSFWSVARMSADWWRTVRIGNLRPLDGRPRCTLHIRVERGRDTTSLAAVHDIQRRTDPSPTVRWSFVGVSPEHDRQMVNVPYKDQRPGFKSVRSLAAGRLCDFGEAGGATCWPSSVDHAKLCSSGPEVLCLRPPREGTPVPRCKDYTYHHRRRRRRTARWSFAQKS